LYPHNGARSREADSLRGLITDLGLGLVGMAKIFEHSLTTVRSKERTKRSDLMIEGNKLSRTVLRGEGGEIPLTYPVLQFMQMKRCQIKIKLFLKKYINELY